MHFIYSHKYNIGQGRARTTIACVRIRPEVTGNSLIYGRAAKPPPISRIDLYMLVSSHSRCGRNDVMPCTCKGNAGKCRWGQALARFFSPRHWQRISVGFALPARAMRRQMLRREAAMLLSTEFWARNLSAL